MGNNVKKEQKEKIEKNAKFIFCPSFDCSFKLLIVLLSLSEVQDIFSK